MTPEPQVVHVDSSVMEAAVRMAENAIGSLIVVDGDQLAGMITDRDITLRCAAEGHDPRSTRIMHVMTPTLVHCHDDAPIAEVASRMAREKVRRVVVLDGSGQLVGVIGLTDLARAPGARAVAEGLLARISAGESPVRESPTGGRARSGAFGEVKAHSQRPRAQE